MAGTRPQDLFGAVKGDLYVARPCRRVRDAETCINTPPPSTVKYRALLLRNIFLILARIVHVPLHFGQAFDNFVMRKAF